MKKLTYYFLLFSTAVFSQNYQYALEEVKKPPGAPTNLVVSNVTSTSAYLTWTASTNASSVVDYMIYSKTGLLVKSSGKSTSYSITGLTPETTYSLTVKASDTDGNLTADSNSQTLTTTKEYTGVKNQPEEIEYFKAYLLPLAQKANLQQALDTYGAVRLEKGDYAGVAVVLHSNQSLYGHPTTNNITSITIAAGSTNVHVESLKPAQDSVLFIDFQAGSPITNCTFKTLKYALITATNAMLENNIFLDVIGNIHFDCSASGYFRNNRIIKHMGYNANILIMRGNRITPSYGNVNIHSNFLSSNFETMDIDNLESATFVGVDCETYGGVTRELLHFNKVDRLKIIAVQGGINYDSGYGYSSIDAGEVWSVRGDGGASTASKLSARTNKLNFGFSNDAFVRGDGKVTGDLSSFYTDEVERVYTQHFEYNGVEQSSTITDPTIISKLSNSILSTKYTPWARPNFEALSDPLGVNWRKERIGKPDSTSYIQNLINTNGVAELPEGVFYISSTLNIPNDGHSGIVGKGTGKTVICGLADDFPLLTVTVGNFGNINLGFLTLQGGSDGLYTTNPNLMTAYQSMKYVVFRDQVNGIHTKNIYGTDNNFWEHLSFVNCTKGIFNESNIEQANGEILGSAYMDKNVFYKCQFIDCDTSMDLHGNRTSNMNAWVECKYDGGKTAVKMSAESTIFANCDFTRFTGDYTFDCGNVNIISCNFYDNTNAIATIQSLYADIEGCNFLDNINFMRSYSYNTSNVHVFNSTITGEAIISNAVGSPPYTLYINSKLLSNSTFSKLLSRTAIDVPTVFIDAIPNPYPQLLVTQ
ncbi:fibronectin type III domain-containing protein [Flavobacterium sp. Arc3]|jgi:hypothetical protein|uniref:fibronectin type III domain-containing protein n=1 Tax=unclassified Flavobacterium TaxID=196869 RepID=UPI00352FE6DD